MDFSSDTSAPAHPAVIEALTAANVGQAKSYGADLVTERVRLALAERFESDLAIWLVSSGTAANALGLSLLCPPTGAILCHEEAHIELDERGAPEFYTGGGKLRLLPGEEGKVDLGALQEAVSAHDPDFFHGTPAAALSLTNLTECGTAYRPEETRERTELARSIGCGIHLDGARIGNALVSSGASLADLTWRAGVDVVTLGLTKLGAMGVEAIVLLGPARERFDELRLRAKRAGQVPAKLRYLAAQAEAMLSDDLWLDLAGRANARAQSLARAFEAAGIALRYPVDGNEVLPQLTSEQAASLSEAGALFYPWPGGCYRFVCSWTTAESEVDALASCLQKLGKGKPSCSL